MQKTVALSSAEAEYYSASEMAIEIIYLHILLANKQPRQLDYTPVFQDNTTCIEWANHVIGGRERAKHIAILKHFAHEAVQNVHMRLCKRIGSVSQGMIQIPLNGLIRKLSSRPRTGVRDSPILSSRMQRSRVHAHSSAGPRPAPSLVWACSSSYSAPFPESLPSPTA